MDEGKIVRLIKDLAALPKETEWVEFKVDNTNPHEIGECVSALSNSAALYEKEAGYIVWGVKDETHELVGTNFEPKKEKKGSEELENWLATQLNPRIGFRIHETEIDDKHFVLFGISPATNVPVSFRGIRYIRIGSYTKKLNDHPDKEKQLWSLLEEKRFEEGVALTDVSSDDVIALIDYPSYFDLTKQPLPDNRAGILDKLRSESFIIGNGGGFYDITNLGAILFAKDLKAFSRLAGKALRVIFYEGTDKSKAVLEREQRSGYAIGFDDIVRFIDDRLPQSEVINGVFREEVKVFPRIAIRELVANALIHQDFNLTGGGPMVEIYSDRIEITNPGTPLIETDRFVDYPPISRNEQLARLFFRIDICELRGSGIDKVLFQVELFQLPAPSFRVLNQHTQVILYAHKSFNEMSTEDKIRACYLHACLRYVSNKEMANTTLRKRFNIDEKNRATASRIITETLNARLIKKAETGSKSTRDAKYIPYWA
jgi:ATP-dependent DNA helicase RecG